MKLHVMNNIPHKIQIVGDIYFINVHTRIGSELLKAYILELRTGVIFQLIAYCPKKITNGQYTPAHFSPNLKAGFLGDLWST